MKKLNFLGLILFSFPAYANYQSPSLKEFLNQFHKDPIRVMNQKPFKSIQNKGWSAFDKMEVRRSLLDNARNKEDFFGVNSISKLFFDNTDILTNAFEIDERPLKTVKLIETPWSSYFWSTEKGLLGNRYGVKKFNRKNNWKDRYEYVTESPASSFSDDDEIELLSPSEKYDLLIGNRDGILTSYMWGEGKKEIAQYKKIRAWSGLCHGLAMASIKYPWPKYSINVKSADGKNLIKFYPEDIKALGIFHWSGSNIPLRKLGGRCELNSPPTDSIGRIKDPNCRDPNPGAFHLALVNRLGIHKKSLLMDSSMDAEVWNYPIVAYSFSFFNPETSNKSAKIKNAMIRLADFKNDKFSQYRSKMTEYVVGVEAKIDYLTHIDPKQEDKDPITNTRSIFAIYRYDLELDPDGKIIGGEWYTNRNPDFLWFPEDNADPKSFFDYLIHSPWAPSKTSLPADWIESANSSAEKGQVSSNILKALFEYSNKGSN